ncbi:hypothetical protein HPB48_016390 [Haemaphysalis longicornis]|uniref:Speckle-type POZ protein n=1 Tax=Haemaphysalis longicornis TaxID=44386 RepID=A0A9J6FPT7_HAELO|nr:hypothetical protein HPB48_016390 [Haemaphysalis longicornis]
MSCETHLKVVKLSYTWTIHSFSMRREETGKRIESSTFSKAGHGNLKWRVQLYPRGRYEESKEFVSLSLELVDSDKNDVLAEYKCAVLDEAGRQTNVRNGTSRFYRGGCWGWSNFIDKSCLQKSTDNLLPNDKLTIYIEVIAFVDSVNISPPNKVVPVNVPECHISEDFGQMVASPRFSDVVFSVEGKDIHAHKIVLATRSPVFAAMFEHEMKENEQGRVEITDCDFEVLHEMLQFMYTGRAPKLNEMAEKILVAAEKYDLGRLKAMCEDVLCKKLSVGTAAEMLVLADMQNADQLKANALEFIKAHAAGVTETDGWKKMAIEKPHLVAEAFRALVEENASLKTGLTSK